MEFSIYHNSTKLITNKQMLSGNYHQTVIVISWLHLHHSPLCDGSTWSRGSARPDGPGNYITNAIPKFTHWFTRSDIKMEGRLLLVSCSHGSQDREATILQNRNWDLDLTLPDLFFLDTIYFQIKWCEKVENNSKEFFWNLPNNFFETIEKNINNSHIFNKI